MTGKPWKNRQRRQAWLCKHVGVVPADAALVAMWYELVSRNQDFIASRREVAELLAAIDEAPKKMPVSGAKLRTKKDGE